jgi:hypothetical protein
VAGLDCCTLCISVEEEDNVLYMKKVLCFCTFYFSFIDYVFLVIDLVISYTLYSICAVTVPPHLFTLYM